MIVLVVRERSAWQWFTADEADALWSRAAAAQRAGSLLGILPCEVPDEIHDADVTRWLFDNVPEISRVKPGSPESSTPVGGERFAEAPRMTAADVGSVFRGPDGYSVWRMVGYCGEPTATLEKLLGSDGSAPPIFEPRLEGAVGAAIFGGFRKLTVEGE